MFHPKQHQLLCLTSHSEIPAQLCSPAQGDSYYPGCGGDGWQLDDRATAIQPTAMASQDTIIMEIAT